MGPIEATLYCLRHPFKWSGRASPSEFWWFTLVTMIVSSVALIPPMMPIMGELVAYSVALEQAEAEAYKNFGQFVAPPPPDLGPALAAYGTYWVIYLALCIPVTFSYWAVLVRRLHDSGRSGWWYWITLVPFGAIILLIFLVVPSEIYKNRFGPRPGGPVREARGGSDIPVVARNPLDDIRDSDSLRALRQSRMPQV